MTFVSVSRRFFLQMAAGLSLTAGRGNAEEPVLRPSDQGIGGTGLSLSGGAGVGDDQGIGGTGVFGTIQRFGSIYVNGLRIRYPDNVSVYVDGERSDARVLRIGHVVRAVLSGPPDSPVTSRIDVTSEVVGKVEHVDQGFMSVLSQRVDLRQAGGSSTVRPGMTVAVFGIRMPDATIVASRIERRDDDALLALRGVAENYGTRMRIGGLVLARPARELAGRRIEVILDGASPELRVQRVAAETLVPGLVSGRVNVETFRQRMGGSISLGIGVTIAADQWRDAPSSSGRTYVNLPIDRNGRFAPGPSEDGAQPNSPPLEGGRPPFGGQNGEHDPNGHEPDRGDPGPGAQPPPR